MEEIKNQEKTSNKKGKKMLKNTKNRSQGITLMVLVVTVVVLLILASVTIAGLIGDKGIIKEARDAKEQTEIKSLEEQIDISIIQAEEKHKRTTLDNVIEELIKNEVITDENQVNKETGSIQTSLGYVIEGKLNEYIGIEEEPEPAKTLVQAFKDNEIKVGDYLNYSNPASGEVTLSKEQTGYRKTQTYEVDQNTTWRVLGLSEDGNNLLLISGSPLKRSKENGETTSDPYFAFGGAEAYYNCESTLNSICAIYKNDLAQEVRSIKAEDITYASGITIDKVNNKAYKTNDPEKKELSGYSGSFGSSYTYKAEDYAPENYLKATYPQNETFQKFEDKKVNDKVDGTSYDMSYEENDIVDKSSQIYDVLFKGTTVEENYAKTYWLASPGVRLSSSSGRSYVDFEPGYIYNCIVHCGGSRAFSSGGSWLIGENGVRPVISLRSEVSLDDLQVITGKEQNWSTRTKTTSLEWEMISDGIGKIKS